MELDRFKLNRLIDRLGDLLSSPSEASAELPRLALEASELAFSLGQVPVTPLFESVTRAARTASAELVVRGGQAEVEPSILSTLSDPILSWFQHALQSGARMLVLQANRNDEQLTFTLMNDGYSIPEGGAVPSLQSLQSAVHSVGGNLQLRSRPQEGTGIVISVPSLRPVISVFVVRVGDRKFALPACRLTEILESSRLRVHTSTGVGRMIHHRGEILPLLSPPIFGVRTSLTPGENPFAGIIVQRGGRKVCIPVDEIIGRRNLQVKPVGAEIRDVPGVMGAALLPHGETALVLDFAALIPQNLNKRRPHAAA